MESPPNAPIHLQKWEREPREREPVIAGYPMPQAIITLCGLKMGLVLFFLAVVLVQYTELSSKLSTTGMVMIIVLAVLAFIAYFGCFIGARKKNVAILTISAGLLFVLILTNIVSNIYAIVVVQKKSDREWESMEKTEDQKDWTPERFRMERTFAAIVGMICSICYHGAIIGLCVIYVKHLRKIRGLEPDVLLPP